MNSSRYQRKLVTLLVGIGFFFVRDLSKLEIFTPKFELPRPWVRSWNPVDRSTPFASSEIMGLTTVGGQRYPLHPGKCTQNLKITSSLKEKKSSSKASFLGFHMNFEGSKHGCANGAKSVHQLLWSTDDSRWLSHPSEIETCSSNLTN